VAEQAGTPPQRTTEQIRREISVERDNLTRSLTDLRAGVHDARKIPLIVGGAVVAGIAALIAVKNLRD
jgi:hypothetical protein